MYKKGQLKTKEDKKIKQKKQVRTIMDRETQKRTMRNIRQNK